LFGFFLKLLDFFGLLGVLKFFWGKMKIHRVNFIKNFEICLRENLPNFDAGKTGTFRKITMLLNRKGCNRMIKWQSKNRP